MALWHWLLGGAAAYLFTRSSSAAAAPSPATSTTDQIAAQRTALETAFVNGLNAAGIRIGINDVSSSWDPASGWTLHVISQPGTKVVVKDLADLQKQLANMGKQPTSGW